MKISVQELSDCLLAALFGLLLGLWLHWNVVAEEGARVPVGTEAPKWVCPVDGHVYWDNEVPCYFCGSALRKEVRP